MRIGIGIGIPRTSSARASGAPFDPIGVAGIIADWDVDDVVDSSGASSLPDRSGNGNNLAQATAGARLAVVHDDADFNGHKSLQGAADDVIARNSLVGGNLAQPITKYAFIKTGADVAAIQLFFSSWTGGATGRADIFISGSRLNIYGGASVTGPTLTPNTPGIVRAIFNGATSKVEWTPAGGSAASVTGNVGTQFLTGSALMAIGIAGAQPFLGKATRFLLYSGIVSDEDDAKITAYLRARYSVI